MAEGGLASLCFCELVFVGRSYSRNWLLGSMFCKPLVPGARLELALCFQNRILSPARLPVPPSRLHHSHGV